MKKILFIDDEIELAALITKRLRAFGFDVMLSEQGDDIFSLVEHHKPDIILLDIKLPSRSGVDIFQDLRTRETTQHIPVIFFSALHEQETYCLETLRADGFIKKPFEAKALLALINKLLSR